MSNSMIAQVLEIEKGKEPNFVAAKDHLDQLKDEDKIKAYCDTHGLSQKMFNEVGLTLGEIYAAFLDSLNTVEEAWNGHGRSLHKAHLISSTALINGGLLQDEDEDEYWFEVSLFITSGMAEAAGFTVAK